jgi:tetratricopeptide (TPR) repeat protein
MFLGEAALFRRRPAVAGLLALLALPHTGCTEAERAAHRANEAGRAAFAKEAFDDAAAQFEQSAAFRVRPWIPTSNLGLVRASEGRYAEAHALFRFAASILADTPPYLRRTFEATYVNLGHSARKLGHYAEAIEAYNDALGVDHNPLIHGISRFYRNGLHAPARSLSRSELGLRNERVQL